MCFKLNVFPLAINRVLMDNELTLLPLSMNGSKYYVSILLPQEKEIEVIIIIT